VINHPGPLLIACLSVGLTGCGLLRTAVETPGRLTSAVFDPGTKAVDPRLVQQRLMRFADLLALEVTHATQEFSDLSGSTEGRLQALSWRLDYTSTMWRLASGPQAFAGLFDTIVLVTGVRAAHEEHWLTKWGEADRPMVESLKRLEQAAWELCGEALQPDQLAEVRQIIERWMAGDRTSRITEAARIPSFVDLADPSHKAGGGVMSELTALVNVDPLVGLEPAVREVEETRQLAERGLYYLQRMPELLSVRVELQLLRSSRSPEVLGALESVQRVSEAAASLATTAEALPANVSAEREAAVAQIAAELSAQRAGLLHDLDQAREPLVELLDNAHRTLDSGQAMSASLTETLRVLDSFVARFTSEPEPGAEAKVPAPAPAAEAEPAKPFDIVEYGVAAERIGVAAKELGLAISTLDRSLPEVQRVLDETVVRGERSVDHLFVRACQWLGLALAGAAIAVVVVRRSTRR
jgi:hypothetical protein